METHHVQFSQVQDNPVVNLQGKFVQCDQNEPSVIFIY